MARLVKLSAATQIGGQRFPSGATLSVDDAVADDLVRRGAGSESGHGAATIPNGTSSVTVQHGLGSTPSSVLLTGGHAETKDAYISALGATSFTITVGSNVTANRAVYYRVFP